MHHRRLFATSRVVRCVDGGRLIHVPVRCCGRDGAFGDAPVRLVHGSGTTPQQDMDLSTQLLADFADPDVPGRLRVHSPHPTAAFSRIDALAGGFPAAQDAARRHGFTPVVRPAAAGSPPTTRERWCSISSPATRRPRDDFRERFAVLGEHLAAGLRTLGVPPRSGPCPGSTARASSA